MKTILLTFVLLFVFPFTVFSQLILKVQTDKNSYAYGEKIEISATVENPTDTIITFETGGTIGCQIDFIFDDEFNLRNWRICTADLIIIEIQPHSKRIYKWILDPVKYGLPNFDGTHKIIAQFENLKDSILIEAPEFNGGQLDVYFNNYNRISVDSIRENLNAEVLNIVEYPNATSEIWQLLDVNFDSVYTSLKNDTIFQGVNYNRLTFIDSVEIVTSVEDAIIKDYEISEIYPNPFNPESSFNILLTESQNIKIDLMNLTGEKIKQIYSGNLKAGEKYNFKITGTNLSSGIYFITISGEKFFESKKAILLK